MIRSLANRIFQPRSQPVRSATVPAAASRQTSTPDAAAEEEAEEMPEMSLADRVRLDFQNKELVGVNPAYAMAEPTFRVIGLITPRQHHKLPKDTFFHNPRAMPKTSHGEGEALVQLPALLPAALPLVMPAVLRFELCCPLSC